PPPLSPSFPYTTLFRSLFSRLHDQRCALGIQQTQVVIRLPGRPFDQTQRANERARKSVAAHRKIEHRAMSGSAMKRIRRKRHLRSEEHTSELQSPDHLV